MPKLINDDLQQLQDRAQQIDMQQYKQYLEKKGFRGYSNILRKKELGQGPRFLEPIDIDAFNLSLEEIKRCKDGKLCYTCSKLGHIASAHSQKKKDRKGKLFQKKGKRGLKHKIYAVNKSDDDEALEKNSQHSRNKEEIKDISSIELAAANSLDDEYVIIQDTINTIERQLEDPIVSKFIKKDIKVTKKSLELKAEYLLLKARGADLESKYRLLVAATEQEEAIYNTIDQFDINTPKGKQDALAAIDKLIKKQANDDKLEELEEADKKQRTDTKLSLEVDQEVLEEDENLLQLLKDNVIPLTAIRLGEIAYVLEYNLLEIRVTRLEPKDLRTITYTLKDGNLRQLETGAAKQQTT